MGVYFADTGNASPVELPAPPGPGRNRAKTIDVLSKQRLGDLWMWLQLMWLQFEVVRGPVGVVRDRFEAQRNPNRPQIDPKRHRPDLGQPLIAAT